jgi:DNA-binding HxlR family transcriptional regulator
LLAQRLKELETYGLMHREVVPTTPVQIRYTPSPSGEELIRALQPLIAWGARRLEQAPQDEDCRCGGAGSAANGT